MWLQKHIQLVDLRKVEWLTEHMYILLAFNYFKWCNIIWGKFRAEFSYSHLFITTTKFILSIWSIPMTQDMIYLGECPICSLKACILLLDYQLNPIDWSVLFMSSLSLLIFCKLIVTVKGMLKFQLSSYIGFSFSCFCFVQAYLILLHFSNSAFSLPSRQAPPPAKVRLIAFVFFLTIKYF